MPSCDACSSDCSVLETIKKSSSLKEVKQLIKDLKKAIPELELKEQKQREKEMEEKRKKEKEEIKLLEKLKKKYENK